MKQLSNEERRAGHDRGVQSQIIVEVGNIRTDTKNPSVWLAHFAGPRRRVVSVCVGAEFFSSMARAGYDRWRIGFNGAEANVTTLQIIDGPGRSGIRRKLRKIIGVNLTIVGGHAAWKAQCQALLEVVRAEIGKGR